LTIEYTKLQTMMVMNTASSPTVRRMPLFEPEVDRDPAIRS
jgi:hypothetical protein